MNNELPKTLKHLYKQYSDKLPKPTYETKNSFYEPEEIIDKNVLGFLEDAKKFFNKYNDYRYIGDYNGIKFIAFRYGMFNDIIQIRKIGSVIGDFCGYVKDGGYHPLTDPEVLEEKEYVRAYKENLKQLNQIKSILQSKDDYIKYITNKLNIKLDELNWFKEKQKQTNYDNWIEGAYISNVNILQGE